MATEQFPFPEWAHSKLFASIKEAHREPALVNEFDGVSVADLVLKAMVCFATDVIWSHFEDDAKPVQYEDLRAIINRGVDEAFKYLPEAADLPANFAHILKAHLKHTVSGFDFERREKRVETVRMTDELRTACAFIPNEDPNVTLERIRSMCEVGFVRRVRNWEDLCYERLHGRHRSTEEQEGELVRILAEDVTGCLSRTLEAYGDWLLDTGQRGEAALESFDKFASKQLEQSMAFKFEHHLQCANLSCTHVERDYISNSVRSTRSRFSDILWCITLADQPCALVPSRDSLSVGRIGRPPSLDRDAKVLEVIRALESRLGGWQDHLEELAEDLSESRVENPWQRPRRNGDRVHRSFIAAARDEPAIFRKWVKDRLAAAKNR